MSTKKTNKPEKTDEYKFEGHTLKRVDKSLYHLLQLAYELKLIPESAFHHATTCETKLLVPIEDV